MFINLLKKIKEYIVRLYYFLVSFFYTNEKFKIYKNNFLILPDCNDSNSSLNAQFCHGNLVKIKDPIVQYYDKLWYYIKNKVLQKNGGVIVRVSDGEAYFLQGKLVGNGPIRHFTRSKKLDSKDVALFKTGLLACESRHIEMLKNNQNKFLKIFRKNIFSEIPFECIYALVSSRKLFKTNYKIGLIGSYEKMGIIKELMNHKDYREYIGREKFDDYIGIPEKGSANNPVDLSEQIQKQLKKDVDIYLVGIGIAKLVILPALKEKSSSLFIDIGAGISALAGLISNERPYFADWCNFRLRGFDYSKVDTMDFNHNKDNFINL